MGFLYTLRTSQLGSATTSECLESSAGAKMSPRKPRSKTAHNDLPAAARQRKTLLRMFEDSTPNDIPWDDIKSLLENIGCIVKNGRGSRVYFGRDGIYENLHKPHPSNQTPRDTVKRVVRFLQKIGVKP